MRQSSSSPRTPLRVVIGTETTTGSLPETSRVPLGKRRRDLMADLDAIEGDRSGGTFADANPASPEWSCVERQSSPVWLAGVQAPVLGHTDSTESASRQAQMQSASCGIFCDDEAALLFRNYAVPEQRPDSVSFSEAGDDEIESSAIDVFLSDFVVSAVDRRFSRGFMDGMPALIQGAGPLSTLVGAAGLVGLASVSNRINRPSLTLRMERRYCHILRAYHQSLSEKDSPGSLESLYTAVLLGIYEILVSPDSRPLRHVPHVRGVCALLSGGVAPLNIRSGVRIFQLGNPLLLKSPVYQESKGVLCAPAAFQHLQSLDTILVEFGRVFYEAEDVLATQGVPIETKQRLSAVMATLDRDFVSWSQSQPESWRVTTIGQIPTLHKCPSGNNFLHAGVIHSYLDLFVAAAWNTYRKSHIMLLDVLLRMRRQLDPQSSATSLQQQASDLVNDLISSIPFHLAARPEDCSQSARHYTKPITPNKPIGGLLLLHPLYAAARSSILHYNDREYLSDCLEWIWENMGIGQARLLAQSTRRGLDVGEAVSYAPELPFQHITEGHVLIWAGMMLEPAS
ncbi:hypothetical protein FDECE_7867 [Fusarium decemcellulare]|nr:hypothetical protein FDECE_7867 [Fusarium decemcellulare]